jgi:hypothetical protein
VKQTPESAVRPRRKVITALAISAVTLAAAPRLEATEPPKKKPAASADQYAFTILIGRLCVDDKFREQFFKSKDANAAMALVQHENMPMSKVVPQWVTTLFSDTKRLAGLKDACKKTEDAANVGEKAQKLPPPCDPWPC